MALKVCDDQGVCNTSTVILGICHALVEAPDLSRLVLNLSLGGDTPIDALEAILGYALDRNVLVAAAGGNEGLEGSPVHYPAAFDLPGLLAVAALQAQELPCLTFNNQPIDPDLIYRVGETFVDEGTRVTFSSYIDAQGQPNPRGLAFIDSTNLAGADGNELRTFGIVAGFDFGIPVAGLTLAYGEYSPNLNLTVNGAFSNIPVATLPQLDGGILGGVEIEVVANSDPLNGTLTLTGRTDSFAIGAAELVLDQICPVVGLDASWSPADFSTRGDYLDLAAPGVNLVSGTPGGAYATFEGTSFATPLVAGGLALARQADPNATPEQIEADLVATARPLPPFIPNEVGAGLLDLSGLP